MFTQKEEVRMFKSEKKVFSSGQEGETTTTVTEVVEETSDGGTTTVKRTVTSSSSGTTERSQAFTSSLKAFQDMSGGQLQARPILKAAPKQLSQAPQQAAIAPEASPASAPPSTARGFSGNSVKVFQEDCLKWHNHYRQKHGVQPLKLSPTLCVYAQEWADKIAKTNAFQHRSNNKYGENLYMKGTSNQNYQVTGKEAVESWYSEIKDHTFGGEPRSMGTGHFTQVVWKSSTELGVAFSKSGGRHYVVANYNPAGNFMGQYAANVPPLK